ncbi:MAG: rhodanese-like domain-containing protein [Candidatus Woesearchaeota archaeon]
MGYGKILLLLVVAILFVATLVAILYDSSQEPILVSIPSQTFSDFQAQHPEIVVIDLRTPQEYSQGHVPGSINIDFYQSDFEQRLDQLDKKQTYVIYCRSGNRSKQALRIMESLGFLTVYELHEGISQCC